MSKNVKNEKSVELNLVAEVAKRLSNGGLKPADVQALLEKKPVGESSLDDKIVARSFGYGFTEANFNETIVYCGQLLKRHRNGGGWVPAEQDRSNIDFPYVAPSVYVGPKAMVRGKARVFDSVKICGHSVVTGNAKLYDNVTIYERAQVYGNAILCKTTSVRGEALVYGDYFGSGEDISDGHNNGRLVDKTYI